jgi:glycine cleavage system H lipoate-binding protein
MVAVFVVLTFLLFILVDYFVLKAQGKHHPAFNAARVFDKKSFFFPDEVLFSKGHLWLMSLKDGLLKIGVDEFIQKSFSSLVLQPVLSEGAYVKKGERILQANVGKNTINFFSPVEGKIKFVNKNINGKKIHDPYGDDWGIIIEPQGSKFEKNNLKSKETAVEWLHQEFARLKDFLSIHTADAQVAGATMYDGGNIVEGVVSTLNETAVKDFENKFLQL